MTNNGNGPNQSGANDSGTADRSRGRESSDNLPSDDGRSWTGLEGPSSYESTLQPPNDGARIATDGGVDRPDDVQLRGAIDRLDGAGKTHFKARHVAELLGYELTPGFHSEIAKAIKEYADANPRIERWNRGDQSATVWRIVPEDERDADGDQPAIATDGGQPPAGRLREAVKQVAIVRKECQSGSNAAIGDPPTEDAALARAEIVLRGVADALEDETHDDADDIDPSLLTDGFKGVDG